MTVKEGFGNRGIGNLECITHKTGRNGPVWFLLGCGVNHLGNAGSVPLWFP